MVLSLAITNLKSPVVLFFVFGVIIVLMKAKVEFPSAITDFISIYLLVAIGFKGGVAISSAGLNTSVIFSIIAAVLIGLIVPLYCFFILWRVGKLKSVDAAAIAAHYGSISVVTYIAAVAFLDNMHISYEGFINGLPAIMEVPAIITALVLASWAKRRSQSTEVGQDYSIGQVLRQVVLSKSVVLLLGSMTVGYITGDKGMESVEIFYKGLFMGMLSLFMLEMGMVAADKVGGLKKGGIFLLFFGILMPPLNALLGVLVGLSIGLSEGGATLLGVLAASCSYIVAPAAMRVSLPKANPAMYLGVSLGVTLPFNLIIGIPLYYYLTKYLAKLFT